MNNVTYIDMTQIDGTIQTFAIIDWGNNEFTSMLKSTYDAQQGNTPTGLNPTAQSVQS